MQNIEVREARPSISKTVKYPPLFGDRMVEPSNGQFRYQFRKQEIAAAILTENARKHVSDTVLSTNCSIANDLGMTDGRQRLSG